MGLLKCSCIILLSLILFVLKIIAYEQSDYIVKTERAIVRSYNSKNAIATVHFFKFNRTYTALNMTANFKRNFGDNVFWDIQAYKFLSNEYRFFPLTMSVNVCEVLKKNEFGLNNMYNCGNFIGCPMIKGVVHICNWGPDYSKFPPYIPQGQYMLEFKTRHFKEELYTLEWYVKVENVCKIC